MTSKSNMKKDEPEISIGVIWKKTLNTTFPTIKRKPELRAICMNFKDATVNIINLYITPHTGELKNKQLEFLNKKITSNKKNKTHLIILEDLNAIVNEELDRWSNISRK